PGWLPPSTRPASSSRGCLHQVVEADDDAECEPDEQTPGAGALPPVHQVSKAAEDEDAANERVAGPGGRAGVAGVLLQGLGGTGIRETAVLLGHLADHACKPRAHPPSPAA